MDESWSPAPATPAPATPAPRDAEAALRQRAAAHRALGDPHRLRIVDELALSDRTPSELAALTGLASNLLAFHLDVLTHAGLVHRSASQGDGRRRYVRLEPGALPGPLGATLVAGLPRGERDVLFVCTANSARSQLAAALWSRRTGAVPRSAGTDPAPRVHPDAVTTAAVHGLDLSDAVPRGYDDLGPAPALVVSVCDRAHEAGLPVAAPQLHWSVPDPVGGGPAAFEAAYAELALRVDALAAAVAVAA